MKTDIPFDLKKTKQNIYQNSKFVLANYIVFLSLFALAHGSGLFRTKSLGTQSELGKEVDCGALCLIAADIFIWQRENEASHFRC